MNYYRESHLIGWLGQRQIQEHPHQFKDNPFTAVLKQKSNKTRIYSYKVFKIIINNAYRSVCTLMIILKVKLQMVRKEIIMVYLPNRPS